MINTKQQILDSSKLKAFADDKISVTQKMISGFNIVENIVRKRENVGQLSIFSFSNHVFLMVLSSRIVCQRVNALPRNLDFEQPQERSLLKTLWEKEKMLAFSPFLTMFSILSNTETMI